MQQILLFLCFTTLILNGSTQGQVSLIAFSVMGDTPYSASDAQKLKYQLANLRPSNEFAVHLGDIKTGLMPCSESWYQMVARILRQSPRPLFIIPGDNEWNDCFNPKDAWKLWTHYFLHFDTHWPTNKHIDRDPRHPENFAFVSNGVLFVGINLVGGKVLDPIQWVLQDQDNIEWIKARWRNSNKSISRLVIFGHALPSENHRDFFVLLQRFAHSFEKPILYLHGDGHFWEEEYPFMSKNIWRVQIQQGGRANPVTVMVTDDSDEPFVFIRK